MRPSTITITPLFVLLVAACASAPKGYRATCDDWGERRFFRSASARLVRTCLEAGAKVDAPEDGARSPLHWAASVRLAFVRPARGGRGRRCSGHFGQDAPPPRQRGV